VLPGVYRRAPRRRVVGVGEGEDEDEDEGEGIILIFIFIFILMAEILSRLPGGNGRRILCPIPKPALCNSSAP